MSEAGHKLVDELRNVAIVAHVDHGKTTLVDAMLWQAGSFRENQDVAERVLDSIDLEREKGITILAKNTAVRLGGGRSTSSTRRATPTSAARSSARLTMVDGVLLLVDASKARCPRRGSCSARRSTSGSPSCSSSTRSTVPTRVRPRSSNEVYELFLDLDADESQIEFPIVYANARAGRAGLDPDAWREDLTPLFETHLRDDPAAEPRPGASAPGARHEPRREPLRRPARAAARPPRDAPQGRADRLVPRQRHDRDGAGDRALRDRGARARSGRGGRAGRDRRPRRDSPR